VDQFEPNINIIVNATQNLRIENLISNGSNFSGELSEERRNGRRDHNWLIFDLESLQRSTIDKVNFTVLFAVVNITEDRLRNELISVLWFYEPFNEWIDVERKT
jgi:hypothetical protein